MEESKVSDMQFEKINDSKVDEESWVNTGMFQLVNDDAMNYTRTETVLDSSMNNSSEPESNSESRRDKGSSSQRSAV